MNIRMNKTFCHADILNIFPWLKARTLISWTERGLIHPLLDAAGRGSSRVYSYTNLIEIGILNELLRYGIPFSLIQVAMRSEALQIVLKADKWESIFWINQELSLADVPMDKAPPFFSLYGIIPVDEFLRNGGKLILKSKEITSAIIINISSLKAFIDGRIKKM
jgi:hypothetical protein